MKPCINLLAATALLGFGAIGPAAAQTSPAAPPNVGGATVDVMNGLWGKHPGMRANHAKGEVVEGTFQAAPDAAKLSKATIFSGEPVPVLVRFSDSTGLPEIPDMDPNAAPHGMGVEFETKSGGRVQLVMNSLGFFPVRDGPEFLQLLQAVAASPPTAPKPTAVEQFMAAHPSAPAAFATVKTPSSFAREHYNGVDAFYLVDAEGKKHPFRFRFTPDEGLDYISAEQAKAGGPNALTDEIKTRLAAKPVKFHVLAQMAEDGDPIEDATKPWPESRKFAELGIMTLTKPVTDSAKVERTLRLLPNQLEPGIEVSNDPLIQARVQAYVISFGRRAR